MSRSVRVQDKELVIKNNKRGTRFNPPLVVNDYNCKLNQDNISGILESTTPTKHKINGTVVQW